jgi:hypothetical protein
VINFCLFLFAFALDEAILNLSTQPVRFDKEICVEKNPQKYFRVRQVRHRRGLVIWIEEDLICRIFELEKINWNWRRRIVKGLTR